MGTLFEIVENSGFHPLCVWSCCCNQITQTGGLQCRDSLSLSSRGRKSEIKVSAGLASPEASVLGFSCVLTWSPLCLCVCVLISSKDTGHIGLGLP